jgi:hypothetical protein
MLATGCGKKEAAPEQLPSQARKDSLMQKSEQVLRAETEPDSVPRKPAPEAATNQREKPAEAPRLPETLPRVDVTLWAGMTYEKLDRLLGEFSLTTPPSIRYYGICDKIVFGMSDATPKGKLRSVTCYLDNSYRVRDALPLLGIAVVKEDAVNGKEYVESTFGNEKITQVRSFITGPDLNTKRIVITYK